MPKRTSRFAVLVAAGLVLGPVMLVAAAVTVSAILSEWFDFRLFDFSGIGVLDWLVSGPGATKNSFHNYLTFMIGGVPAGLCFLALEALWEWARS